MNGENQPLVTHEPIEFEKYNLVDVQHFCDRCRQKLWSIPELNKEKDEGEQHSSTVVGLGSP